MMATLPSFQTAIASPSFLWRRRALRAPSRMARSAMSVSRMRRLIRFGSSAGIDLGSTMVLDRLPCVSLHNSDCRVTAAFSNDRCLTQGIIVHRPTRGQWPVDFEEVSQPRLVSPPNVRLRNIVAAGRDSKSDPRDREFLGWQPEEHQMKRITFDDE